MTDIHRHWPELLREQTGLRDRLVEAYQEPRRGYHNVRHLQEVFARIDAIMGAGASPDQDAGRTLDVDLDAVRLAAWFHDAVYDANGENEERSARLAEAELAAAAVPAALLAEVARLVRLTATHGAADGDLAGQVLCDADLGILAVDEPRYREYTEGVRREYEHVPDEDFRKGRARVLRSLVDRPTLFNTSFAKQHWEKSARRNVERELAGLAGLAGLAEPES